MKNRRFPALIMALAMSLTLVLTACGGGQKAEAKNVPVTDIYDAIAATQELPMSMDLDEDTLKDMYGMDLDNLEAYVCKFPMMMVHATEFFIGKVKDGKMDDVKTVLENRQKALAEQWSSYLPEQLELVENYKLVTNGNYVLFAVCEDADAAVNAFNEALK